MALKLSKKRLDGTAGDAAAFIFGVATCCQINFPVGLVALAFNTPSIRGEENQKIVLHGFSTSDPEFVCFVCPTGDENPLLPRSRE